MVSYDYWGLSVASDRDWPELGPFKTAEPLDGACEVRLTSDPPGAQPQPRAAIIQPQYGAFAVAGVGRFAVSAGRDIRVSAVPGASPAALQLFLFGSAWGLLAYQRGLTPMHASVVAIGGRAVAFCGASGAGKSSLVAALTRRGHALVCDDLCRVDRTPDGAARVWPSLPRLKLWRATLNHLAVDAAGLQQDLPAEDKFHLPYPQQVRAPIPLAAIYLLEWGSLGCAPLTGTTALRSLLAEATYRSEWLEGMGRLTAHWQAYADVLRGCRVYRLSRPRDWAWLERSADLAEAAIAPSANRF